MTDQNHPVQADEPKDATSNTEHFPRVESPIPYSTDLNFVVSGSLDSLNSHEFSTTIVLDPPLVNSSSTLNSNDDGAKINNNPYVSHTDKDDRSRSRVQSSDSSNVSVPIFSISDSDSFIGNDNDLSLVPYNPDRLGENVNPDRLGENVNSDSEDSLSSSETRAATLSRRNSKWSATILFVASEVQLIINLAEFNREDGYVTAPPNKKPEGNSDDKDSPSSAPNHKMENGVDVEMQAVPHSQKDVAKDRIQNGKDPPRHEKDLEKNSLLADKHEEQIIPNGFPPETGIKLPKENWGKKGDFLLAVIGYSVDLSNVWRFPYLAYKNGGGAFIIPYFTVLILGAIPVFLMELGMGQFTQEGPIGVWKMSPLFRGIGYASCLMAYIVAFYYNMVIGWSFYYLFSSFSGVLPWTSCDHDYNSDRCWPLDWDTNKTFQNRSYEANTSVSSAFEFFERGMLGLHASKGIDDLGKIKWQLALCIFLTFTILYFSLWKSVKSSGKVVWFTATIPYLILTILLIRGALLPGAGEGVKYFVTPNVSRLGNVQASYFDTFLKHDKAHRLITKVHDKPDDFGFPVLNSCLFVAVWIDAAVQIFFSIGAGFGTHIAYASYNKFNNNCYRDCLITAAVNSFTSIFSGFVVFTYLGYMAVRQSKDINDVAQDGPGLVFIVYPEAIATLPGSTAWSMLFFFMLVTLGMDSAFGGLESPLTGLRDKFYRLTKHRWSREILTFLIISTAFLFSLPCTTDGGMYVFKILDTFAAGTSILFAVLCQVIAIAWIYGVDQFCRDIHQMTGYHPSIYWRICWKFLCPTFLLILVISSFLHYRPLVYKGGNGTYVYPQYANTIGWMIALSTMALIPLYALFKLIINTGSFKERVAFAITPTSEHELIRRTQKVKRFEKRHWLSI